MKLSLRRIMLQRDEPFWPKHPVPVLIAYTEDQRACPFLIVNGDGKEGKIAERLSALYLAKVEIFKSKNILRFLLKIQQEKRTNGSLQEGNDGNLAEKAFFDSAVLWYAKLFIDSDLGRVKLDYRSIYKQERHLTLHNEIIQLRHRALAHQSLSFEGAIPFIALNPDESKKEIVEIYYNLFTSAVFDNERLKEMIVMTEITEKAITDMICHAEDRLLKALSELEIDYLYARSAKPI